MIRRAAFIDRFLLPLVEGGEVHIGPPLGFGGLSRIADEPADTDAERRLETARWAVASELLPHAEPPTLDEESLRLGIALHDLLFLHHPEAPDPQQGGGARHVIAGSTLLAALETPEDARELISRHTILHRLRDLGRVDVRVSFWVGKREFQGRRPPARLTAWPRVRRVSEERWRVDCLAELCGEPSRGAEVVRALFAASPLTNLLDPLRDQPPFDLFGDAVDAHAVAPGVTAALRDPVTCRLVVARWLELGLSRTGAALAGALVTRLGAREVQPLARLLLALGTHLQLCLVVAGPAAADALLQAASSTPEDSALRDFLGLAAAFRRVGGERAAPADLERDPALARRFDDHLDAAAQLCDRERLAELSGLVGRTLDLIIPLAEARG